MTVHYEIADDVAVITLDNPPVNALSSSVSEALFARLEDAAGDDSVRSVVLMGGGGTFSAGARSTVFAGRRGDSAAG